MMQAAGKQNRARETVKEKRARLQGRNSSSSGFLLVLVQVQSWIYAWENATPRKRPICRHPRRLAGSKVRITPSAPGAARANSAGRGYHVHVL